MKNIFININNKRIKIIIFSFFICTLTSFFTINSSAATWKYEWFNTLVEVPLGDTVENYKKIPYAILYKDNVALTDTNITIDYNGDYLFYLKNVNTNKIGEYKVWYKAYESKYIPGTCNEYKCLITFKVRDYTKPKLDIISDPLFLAKDSDYNLDLNVVSSDDYGDVSLVYNTNLNINRLGEYDVFVTAKDISGNYDSKEFKVIVYDNSSLPIISCNQYEDDIYIPYKMDFDITKFFTAIDSKDGDITDKIIYPPLTNDSICTYNYTISVSNNSLLTSYYTVKIHVVDEEEPVLELTQHELILDYKTDFENYNFMQHIKKLSDNLPINKDNIKIEHNLENNVGNYIINYSYNDGVYEVADSISVNLFSFKSPKIKASDIEMKVSSNINLYDYVSVSDESDINILDSLIIDDNEVNYNSEGEYFATAYCMNSSGLSSQVKFKVIVTSDSIFSSSNIGITLTIIIIFSILIIVSLGIGIYLFLKKKRRTLKESI